MGALHIALILLGVYGSEGVVTVVVEDDNPPCPCSFVCSPCWGDCPDGN